MEVAVRFLDDGKRRRYNGENDRHHPVSRSAGGACQCILERTNEDRLEAKVKGVKFGRKRTIDTEKIRTLHKNGIGATDIARQMGIGRSTVYKSLNEAGK